MTTFLINFFTLFYKNFQKLPKNYQFLPKIVYVCDVDKTVKNHQKITKKLANFTNKIPLKFIQKVTQIYLKNSPNFTSKFTQKTTPKITKFYQKEK